MWSNSQVNQEWWPHMEVVFCFKYAAKYRNGRMSSQKRPLKDQYKTGESKLPL